MKKNVAFTQIVARPLTRRNVATPRAPPLDMIMQMTILSSLTILSQDTDESWVEKTSMETKY